MKYRFEDFTKEHDEIVEVRIPCPLGENCKHTTVDECDQYRQQLLEEEHKKNCGPDCAHFNNPVKGVPFTARYTGEGPADFLKRTRGVR